MYIGNRMFDFIRPLYINVCEHVSNGVKTLHVHRSISNAPHLLGWRLRLFWLIHHGVSKL